MRMRCDGVYQHLIALAPEQCWTDGHMQYGTYKGQDEDMVSDQAVVYGRLSSGIQSVRSNFKHSTGDFNRQHMQPPNSLPFFQDTPSLINTNADPGDLWICSECGAENGDWFGKQCPICGAMNGANSLDEVATDAVSSCAGVPFHSMSQAGASAEGSWQCSECNASNSDLTPDFCPICGKKR